MLYRKSLLLLLTQKFTTKLANLSVACFIACYIDFLVYATVEFKKQHPRILT